MNIERMPKILHFIWFNFKDPTSPQEPPRERAPFQRSWATKHPNWDIMVWNDLTARYFLEENYEWFVPIYDSYRHPIQRADVIRYFILHHYGGAYVDWDYQCFRNIESLLFENPSKSFFIGREPATHESGSHWHGNIRPIALNNGWMAARKGCDFLEFTMNRLETPPKPPGIDDWREMFDEVLVSTGPFFLTECYFAYPKQEELHIMDHRLFCPLDATDARYNHNTPEKRMEVAKKFNSYAIHTWDGSWCSI